MREAWEIKRLVYACSRASSNFSQNNLSNNEGMYPIFGASGLIKNVSFYTPDKPYLSISKNGCMPFLVSHSKINPKPIRERCYCVSDQQPKPTQLKKLEIEKALHPIIY